MNIMPPNQPSSARADKYSLVSFLGILFFFFSCTDTSVPPEKHVEAIDSTAIKAAILHAKDSTYTAFFVQQYIEDLSRKGVGVIRGEQLFSDVMLPDLYESFAYQLIWKDSLHRKNALHALASSDQDGLVPETYHLKAIQELLLQNSDDYEIKAGIDLLITDGIILYGTHLLNGKTDPRTLEPTLSYNERSLSQDLLLDMRKKLLKGEVDSIVSSLRPPSQYYKAMMKGLAFYEAIADTGAWKRISISEKKLEPGNAYPEIPKIRKRMAAELDLVSTDYLQGDDSTADRRHYDRTLELAVQRFQMRHGLNPDGVIGKGTIEAMNIPVEEKVKLLKANMERARWIHHDLDSNYVLVNIAGYDLRLVKGDTLCWETRVMTGKIATATPVFKDEMQYVEFNPFWTVPFSISNGEILPKLKSDPAYLRRNNMDLLSMSGTAVPVSSVDFSKFSSKMPYILRQGPGGGNALGRVKFLFPNKFSIYLHDTPSRSLFAREARAFSHGCIRVEDPLKLASLVLHDQGFSTQKIDSIVNTGKNFRVNLKKKLPVLITYATAFADQDLVYFYKDVYKRDDELMKALGL